MRRAPTPVIKSMMPSTWCMLALSITTTLCGFFPLNGMSNGSSFEWTKAWNVSPSTEPVTIVHSNTPFILMHAILLMRSPLTICDLLLAFLSNCTHVSSVRSSCRYPFRLEIQTFLDRRETSQQHKLLEGTHLFV